ncbi:MAG: tRNA (adenosine(37)-N6)-threonylcarbamoyltransferase complex ATPase subunit type 1 TsaE [Bacteriovorax sp.]|jgi:tRNA threonylcarbamoyladenosine biosynthesis protein TsaE|nr:tRNA (adenosine(37)-N6)-threonylcarbamoyltransferase complex ATPase subunit type 1 TsaE [Bacteriovorax sp.]
MNLIRSWKKVLESDLSNIAIELKEVLQPPCVIILEGAVGAGKTTFTRAFLDKKETTSPTYSIVNEIDNIVHADLYRIEKKEELIHLEIPMYLEEKDYFLIEWGMPYLYELQKIIGDEFKYYQLKIEIVNEETRHFFLSKL